MHDDTAPNRDDVLDSARRLGGAVDALMESLQRLESTLAGDAAAPATARERDGPDEARRRELADQMDSVAGWLEELADRMESDDA